MSEFKQSNPPKKPTRRYRIAGLGLFSLVLILGWVWQSQPLNEEERKIVGRWTNESIYDNGNREENIWGFADDRTMTIHSTFVFAETEDEEIKPRINMVEATWRIKNGQIVFIPNRSGKKRLKLSFLKLANAVSGRKFIDGELGEGRVKFPETDQMIIQWYDPITKKYQNEKNQMRRDWTRVK